MSDEPLHAMPLHALERDARLDPTIQFDAPLTAHSKRPRALFLTGATGFLGAYLLDELLRQTDAAIYCLVRAADQQAAQERLQSQLQRRQFQLAHQNAHA